MKDLNEIYRRNRTDKGNEPLVVYVDGHIAKGHAFGNVYQRHFENYIGKSPKILEIGVLQGRSMAAHNEFFEGDCTVFGIDIENQIDINLTSNMYLLIGDSNSPDTVREIAKYGKFDIIIDDAKHSKENQIRNLIDYSRMLNPGGIYILEDLHCNVWGGYSIDCPLFFLTTGIKSKLMTQPEYEWLVNHIDNIEIQSRNEWNSITSVIKFK